MKINIEKFCNSQDERTAYQKPFRIDGNGIYASNGIILVYFSDVDIDIDSVPLVINVDIYKKCTNLIRKSRNVIDGFQSVTSEMLENALKGIIPIKLPIPNPVNFNKVYIDYKYLKLIQEVIKDNKGIWEMRLEKGEVCIFRCEDILICVMPINNYEKSEQI